MTSCTIWPWMLNYSDEEEDLVQMDEVQEEVEDNRPLVKDLIREHCSRIDKIKMALQDHPLYESEKHDDLWILRFWLTHKKTTTAINAAKHTLEFRKELGLDQWDIRDYSPTDCHEGTMVSDFLQYWEKDALVFTPPSLQQQQQQQQQQGPMCFFKLTRMDQHKIVQELTEDYWFALIGHCAEWSFQWADYVTRKTGKFTKATCTFDAAGVTLGCFNSECSRRNRKALSILEEYYPQTLEIIHVCNTPLVLRTLWRMVVRFVMPKSIVSKVNIHASTIPTTMMDDSGRSVMNDDSLPKQFGSGGGDVHPILLAF